MKKFFFYVGLALMMVLMTGVLSAMTPAPDVTFELVQGLPSTMNVGDTYTVVVAVTSEVPFTTVQAMPDPQYPGKGVVPVQGGDHVNGGTSATVEVTFTAKSDTSRMPDGEDVMAVVVGVRYKGGVVVVKNYDFKVSVP